MDTLLCNDDGDIVIGTYDPSNTLLRLSADQYTAGSATWADQSGNALDFTVSTNTSLKGTDADGFPYMNFSGELRNCEAYSWEHSHKYTRTNNGEVHDILCNTDIE